MTKKKAENIGSGGRIVALLTNHDDDIYCFRKELIEALIREGYRVLISCPYGDKFTLMTDIDYIYDDPVIDRRGTNIVSDYKLYRHYLALFKRHRPFAVLTYTAKPNVYAGMAARRVGIPYICNVTGFGSVLNMNAVLRTVVTRLFRHSYRGAYCIMFQNASNMELAKKLGMVNGKYRLIPGSGVDISRFPLASYPDGGNGIDGDTVVFNYIGRIMKDKGADDYIEAARRIKKEYPNTEFNMIGFIEPTESHYEKELAELETAGVLKYHGSQLDVRPFIARSHATIHPSTYGEGMSNVLLESASSGRALITTDNPGCRETVTAGSSGYIYPKGDVDVLCDKIRLFLSLDNDKRAEMGRCGRKHMEDNFSRELVIKAYLEVLYKLVEKVAKE